jgi:hypothetical protein
LFKALEFVGVVGQGDSPLFRKLAEFAAPTFDPMQKTAEIAATCAVGARLGRFTPRRS